MWSPAMIAIDVGAEGAEPRLHPRECLVHAQHQVAVLGRRPDQELGRVRAGEGADQHGVSRFA